MEDDATDSEIRSLRGSNYFPQSAIDLGGSDPRAWNHGIRGKGREGTKLWLAAP